MFGKISLYVQRDAAGNIVQRIVVKTASVPHEMWIQARRWHIDALDPTKAPEHMEIAVMEKIANVEGNHKCVRLQHYTTDRSTFSYRLYVGYLHAEHFLSSGGTDVFTRLTARFLNQRCGNGSRT